MQKCTLVSVFKARMEELEETDERIVISVVENFFYDKVGVETENHKIESGVNSTLKEFITVLELTSKKLRNSRFVVIEPMERPAVKWYTEGLKELTTEYAKMINGVQLINVTVIKRCDLPKQVFDKDLVHLTSDSGKQFLNSIMYYAGQG